MAKFRNSRRIQRVKFEKLSVLEKRYDSIWKASGPVICCTVRLLFAVKWQIFKKEKQSTLCVCV